MSFITEIFTAIFYYGSETAIVDFDGDGALDCPCKKGYPNNVRLPT
ncbi:hypothetical protein SAMN05518846_103249 [Brevibacillus centrosporus]|uniref:Uncharacterized protein n=1 Tax=Brevibacillus centrosporus TaxID=54910 RepID=A0A1I3R0T7_9BACL|nr:hypothetical protein SAMN05518846_103249 [Brevibacillus centrosporus]